MAIVCKLHLDKAKAKLIEQEILTSGMKGARVDIEFSDEWNGLGKVAVFTAGDVKRTVTCGAFEWPLNGSCKIPTDCLETPRVELTVGVVGTSGAQIIIPSVYASLGVIREGSPQPHES